MNKLAAARGNGRRTILLSASIVFITHVRGRRINSKETSEITIALMARSAMAIAARQSD